MREIAQNLLDFAEDFYENGVSKSLQHLQLHKLGTRPSEQPVLAAGSFGEIGMSADWYFLKNGFFNRRKRIGPICENELLIRIEKGELNPETMMSSTSKTHGHWMPMREIKPAMKHWKKTHPDAA